MIFAAFFALSAPARAAACCGPTGGDLPATLARCERVGAALVLADAVELGRWGGDGGWVATSETWSQGTATLGLAGRATPWLTLNAALPLVVTRKTAGSLATLGAGPGDASLIARFEPWDPALKKAAPTFVAGLVAPLGRPADEAVDPLQADVTGQGHWLGVVGAGVERAVGTWPWHASARLQSGAGGEESRLDLSAGLSRHFGGLWIAGASLGTALGLDEQTRRTGLDAQVIRSFPPRARLWLSAGSDLPVSALGADLHGEARISAGLLLVR